LTTSDELIAGCKAGDPKAYELLYKKYYRVLYGIALRYCRTTFEAEDILQDSFVKILKHIHTFKGEGSFEGWIKRIVQNTAINNYKSNLKLGQNIDPAGSDLAQSDDTLDTLFSAMEAKEIVQLLNMLPAGYRLVINLYCIDGHSHQEIAEMLGISVGTSKSQLSKGRALLRRMVEEQFNIKIDGE